MPKQIATFSNPEITACIKESPCFEQLCDAQEKIQNIADNFELSNKFEQNNSKITLWIKGYNISNTEHKKGYLGNFADIEIKESDGLYSLKCKKRKISLKFHPQKKRTENAHPNWGHPILRDIKNGRIFNKKEEATEELARLHAQFPNTSISTSDKLLIIIYEKIEGEKQKTHKYILQATSNECGGFIIECKLNHKIRTNKNN